MGRSSKPEKLAINSMHHQICVFYHGKLAASAMNLKNGIPAPKNICMIEPPITSIKTSIGTFSALAWSLRSVDKPKDVNSHDDYWSILEAFSITGINGTEMLAVQWHPEELGSTDLIRNFFLKKSESKPKEGIVVAN